MSAVTGPSERFPSWSAVLACIILSFLFYLMLAGGSAKPANHRSAVPSLHAPQNAAQSPHLPLAPESPPANPV